ncbi:MAG: dihydroxyacetone kinase subunit DhaK [Anaerolineae bacterium]|nr:dihydroxyacetone kinase subunit DhaK [Anaerolineae bacterium]
MKKLMNDPKNFVPEMMKGVELANPGTIKYVPEYNLVMRADAPNPNKVSIVQGSGSGHEPAHIMVVGKGMLDGACPGDVFSAPPMDYVVESTKILNSPKGVLHIVNNYSGDRMSFEMATEMLEMEGVTVKTIFVDDDVAVQDSTWTVGRRGVAGNFFVIKAVGAASERGASLDELVALGQKVNSMVRSMGMALTGCTPPAKGKPIFTLEEDEIEMGVGIHGEPGRARKKLVSANEIADEMLEAILTDRKPIPGSDDREDPIFHKGDEVALMINGLGGTPISELYIVYGHVHEELEKRGIKVWRSYVGEYCTSLEMAGMSITLCKVDDELKDLFTAPAEIPIRVF